VIWLKYPFVARLQVVPQSIDIPIVAASSKSPTHQEIDVTNSKVGGKAASPAERHREGAAEHGAATEDLSKEVREPAVPGPTEQPDTSTSDANAPASGDQSVATPVAKLGGPQSHMLSRRRKDSARIKQEAAVLLNDLMMTQLQSTKMGSELSEAKAKKIQADLDAVSNEQELLDVEKQIASHHELQMSMVHFDLVCARTHCLFW